jgi:hypothetical protein
MLEMNLSKIKKQITNDKKGKSESLLALLVLCRHLTLQ